ncbi:MULTISPECIES: lysozyme [unclassified Massilia]|uniref:lysozyme n=1 Tax=unclassified Massilia TaxID=2609279 RepID=UPI0018D22078|nr:MULTISPECIES: lysozyme [unclassified Massilia]
MPPADMKPSPACRALVCASEQRRLIAYLCPAGVPTIGWGHTKGVKIGDTCSVQQADIWLSQDLEDTAATVASLVKVPLTQGQFDALCDFVFNLGAKKFGSSTLLILLNKGRMDAAADQFRLWVHAKVNGKDVILPGLVKRRAAEAAMFLGRKAVAA